MKKPVPSNLKPSRQTIDQIGRSSQGGLREDFTPKERRFLSKAARRKAAKRPKYTLKDAMRRVSSK